MSDAPTEKDLVAQAKKEYPRDKALFRARLDQLLIDNGYMAPLDDRPSVSLSMASRTLKITLPELVKMCEAKQLECIRGRSKGGNRTYRIPVEEFERLKSERSADA